jgi:phage terminase large subunit-like protein
MMVSMTVPGTLAQLRADAKQEGWDRFIRTESDEAALLEGYRFSLKRAERVETFGRRYVHHGEGRWAGKPFELMRWQRERVVHPLFGWIHKDTHLRRFRRAGIWVPKKNGKSALCSLLALYLLSWDGEPGAKVYAAAVDREQAGIVFDASAEMVRTSPALASRMKVIASTKTITHGSCHYRALSKENAKSQGKNASALICDEVHVWDTPSLRKLWWSLYYATIARDQPLAIAISTAGEDDPEALWTEEYEKAKAILLGEIRDIRFLPFVAEASAEDVKGEGWKDPKVHRKANPSYGVTIDPAEIAESACDAALSAGKKVNFLRYRLNRPAGQITPWLDKSAWDACDGEPCCGAFDLSKNNDFTCYVLVRSESETNEDGEADDRYHVKPYFWVPEGRIEELEKQGKHQYRQWADAGLIEVIPGPTIKLGVIRRRIPEIQRELDVEVVSVGYDPWQAWETAEKLAAEDDMEMVDLRQGMKTLAAPSKKLEEKLLSRKLNHGGHPILAWMFANVKLKWDDNQNFRPAKPAHNSPKKVDGIVALAMAIHRVMARPVNGGSIYDTQDVKEL